MVIGSGLIAKAFSNFDEDENIIIFASGVSNSTENDSVKFDREENMIAEALDLYPEALFVYFSTYSLTDPSLKDRPYGRHKSAMEGLIKSKASKYLIFRLTNIVGAGGNPNTIFNYLLNGIMSKQKLVLWKNASRNLLDVDDLVHVISRIIEEKLLVNQTINIANPNNYTIEEIVNEMSNFFNVKARCSWLDKGSNVSVDIQETKELMSQLHDDYSISYLSKLLEKYYGGQEDNTIHI